LAILFGIGILGGAYLFLKNVTNDKDAKIPVIPKVAQTVPAFNSTPLTRNAIKEKNQPNNEKVIAQNSKGVFVAKVQHLQKPGYIQPFVPSSGLAKSGNSEKSASISIHPETSATIDTIQGLRLTNSSETPEPKIIPQPQEKESGTKGINDSALVSGNHQSLPDTISEKKTFPGKKQNKHSKHGADRTWNIHAGVYYMPEWIFNSLDRNKYINNFGAEGVFHFGPYSITTGIGMSATRAYNEMVVETNHYLGSYKQLDSMTYHWDSRHYYLIKTVYTSLHSVFDTTLHYNYYTRQMEYTYLQVPLILGDDFLKLKWFALGVRAGPVMSVLVKTRVLTSAFDAGKDKIVTINDISPGRIQLNWQAMAGVNAAFRISRRFVIELDPNIRYYFDSVNEKLSPADKPWSVGLQTSFFVIF